MAVLGITLLYAGLTAFQATSQIKTAKSQAKAVAQTSIAKSDSLKEEGDLAVQQKAKEIKLRTARQTASFITSGLTMEGTPQDVLAETFDTGIADIENIGKNYQQSRLNILRGGSAQIGGIIDSGRNAAIGTIANSFSSFGSRGIGSSSLFNSPLSSDIDYGAPLPILKPTIGGLG